jgi:flagellar biosynthesis protein FliP
MRIDFYRQFQNKNSNRACGQSRYRRKQLIKQCSSDNCYSAPAICSVALATSIILMMTREWRFNVVQELLQYSTGLNQRNDTFYCSINIGLFCIRAILPRLYKMIHTFPANYFHLIPVLISNTLQLICTNLNFHYTYTVIEFTTYYFTR